jgi:hypothetical protein
MFIRTKYSGYDSGRQVAAGDFMILCLPKHDGRIDAEEWKQTRALVRYVRMTQLGHFMMGTFRAFGHSITVSGTYGQDGLICDVPQEVYDRAVPVPTELMKAWAKGGGWNSAGSEAPAMRAWALSTFPATKRMTRS